MRRKAEENSKFFELQENPADANERLIEILKSTSIKSENREQQRTPQKPPPAAASSSNSTAIKREKFPEKSKGEAQPEAAAEVKDLEDWLDDFLGD